MEKGFIIRTWDKGYGWSGWAFETEELMLREVAEMALLDDLRRGGDITDAQLEAIRDAESLEALQAAFAACESEYLHIEAAFEPCDIRLTATNADHTKRFSVQGESWRALEEMLVVYYPAEDLIPAEHFHRTLLEMNDADPAVIAALDDMEDGIIPRVVTDWSIYNRTRRFSEDDYRTLILTSPNLHDISWSIEPR